MNVSDPLVTVRRAIEKINEKYGCDATPKLLYQRRWCRRLSPEIFLELGPRTLLVRASALDQLAEELQQGDKAAA